MLFDFEYRFANNKLTFLDINLQKALYQFPSKNEQHDKIFLSIKFREKIDCIVICKDFFLNFRPKR